MKRLVILLLCMGCGELQDDTSDLLAAWRHQERPSIFGIESQDYRKVAHQGFLPGPQTPWPGPYWPRMTGGSSHQWQVQPATNNVYDFVRQPQLPPAIRQNPESFSSLNENQQREVASQIARLSPTEKYDIVTGAYNFPVTYQVRNYVRTLHEYRRSMGSSILSWEGICDGWAAASINEAAPGNGAVINNGHGIPVTFYAADVKALFSEAYSKVPDQMVRFMGGRCEDEGQGRCGGLNAGAFHLVLNERLGSTGKQKGFIVDITNQADVWNHPVFGYHVLKQEQKRLPDSSRISARAPGTRSTVDVETLIFYTQAEHPNPNSVRRNGQDFANQVIEAAKSRRNIFNQEGKFCDPVLCAWLLKYSLELDYLGNVIGGEWYSSSRPANAWKITEPLSTFQIAGEISLDLNMLREISNRTRR